MRSQGDKDASGVLKEVLSIVGCHQCDQCNDFKQLKMIAEVAQVTSQTGSLMREGANLMRY